ncbi:hypothetical protein D3C87_2102440 [compost metagenome]|jgi:hypothetical protein
MCAATRLSNAQCGLTSDQQEGELGAIYVESDLDATAGSGWKRLRIYKVLERLNIDELA